MDITLALGGGGAKGIAHIGVLRVLEREGFNIRAVAGTSIGGVMGAFYTAGHSPSDIQTMAEEAKELSLFRARPQGAGLLGVQAIEEWLRSNLGAITFEELSIPLAVTAANLETGEVMVLQEGGVVDAVLATIALPGIFPPRSRNDHRLVDGGVVDPVPVVPARALADLPTVAVVLSPPREDWASEPATSVLEQFPILGAVSRLRPAQALQVFVLSLELTARYYTDLRLELDKPDVIIRPAVSHVGLLDEGPSVSAVVALGEKAAEAALPECRAQFTLARRLGRGLRSLRKA
jgi:NTE family protein